MSVAQPALFGPALALPEGFMYVEDFLEAAEERAPRGRLPRGLGAHASASAASGEGADRQPGARAATKELRHSVTFRALR